MSQAMFSNFNPDALKKGRVEVNFEAMPLVSVWMVVMQLLDICAKWHRYDNAPPYITLSNAEFFDLAASIEELARIGFENKGSIQIETLGGASVHRLAKPNTRLRFEDRKVIDWAFHGLQFSPGSNTTHSQIYAYAALLLMDQAITTAGKAGITAAFADDLATATFYLAEARATEYMQAEFKQFMRDNDSDRESDFKRRESQIASIRAAIRHEPTRVAREFIQAEWEKNQAEYQGNKSAFARDYVSIIAHKFSKPGGDPVKITEKQMRDVWLADYPPTRKRGGQRAGG